MLVLLEIVLAAVIAGLLDTVAGFGGALLLLPILVLVVGGGDAVLLTAIIPLGWNLVRIWMLREWVLSRPALLFGIGILPGAFLGASLLTEIDPSALKMAIGALLVGYGIYYIVRLYVELPRPPVPPQWVFPIAGIAAGAIAGVLGAGNGPLQSWTFSAAAMSAREITATNGALGVITSVARLASYGLKGLLHDGLLLPGLAGILGAAAGSFWGVRLSLRATDSTLELVLGAAILLAGVRMLL